MGEWKRGQGGWGHMGTEKVSRAPGGNYLLITKTALSLVLPA